MERRKSSVIDIGGVKIGGSNPIAVQSMTNTKTSDKQATLAQIKALASAGCDIVRMTVNNDNAADAVSYLCQNSPVPLVADIHFDYRLALKAADAGIAKLRINPGNIGEEENVRAVAQKCKEKHIPIRIGINGGSLEKRLLQKYGGITAMALCESALSSCKMLEKYGFYDIALSVKSSDTQMMIEANRILSRECEYPLHLGVTETGTPEYGIVKSAVGIGSLLCDGIGDTIRVSLTADPVQEVYAAKKILKSCGLLGGIDLISCPTCGRTGLDIIGLSGILQKELDKLTTNKPLKVALMGCVVNGPGEAASADVGAACSAVDAVIFKKGVVIRKVEKDEIISALISEVKELL